MISEQVEWHVVEGVATVTLNNPPLNVVTLEMSRKLDEVLPILAEDPGVRVLILTGAGERAFCAGSDISEFPNMLGRGKIVPMKLEFENQVYGKVAKFPKPTIAAVTGLAYGGGLELAVCCDFIVVDEATRLGLPEIKLGVFPGSGGTVRVTRRIGESRAKEMMFYGEPIDASTALLWGLVNRVVPVGQSRDVAQAMAQGLAGQPNRALQFCKAAIALSYALPEDEAIRDTMDLSDQVFDTEDCREGVRAFFAKEKPRFKHR
ncbi:MAG TPA: enoyl-CoA hydratase-related protein [Castellaniella sp.]|uniref:enoyl-CoA hydratase/isomerase family protein n=1 Tax=Castellaniella sp. TaxID=1955812 RepID=UPI002F072C6E